MPSSVQQCAHQYPDDHPESASSSWPSISRSIVRLHSYTSLAAAERMVASALSGVLAWHFPPRPPLAAAHDTDFVVVAAAVSEQFAITKALEASAFVRDVHTDRVMHRKLSSNVHGKPVLSRASQAASHSAKLPPGPVQQLTSAPPRHGLFIGTSGDCAEAVTKKSGRLRTAWSIDPENDVSDIDKDAAAVEAQAAIIQSRFRAHGRSQAQLHSHTAVQNSLGMEGKSRKPGESKEKQDNGKFPAGHAAAWGSLLHSTAEMEVEGRKTVSGRRLQLQAGATQVTSALLAPAIWKKGFVGRGIRVGAPQLILRGSTANLPPNRAM
jgi:hypothetical protein